jgi:hypothetical protein
VAVAVILRNHDPDPDGQIVYIEKKVAADPFSIVGIWAKSVYIT